VKDARTLDFKKRASKREEPIPVLATRAYNIIYYCCSNGQCRIGSGHADILSQLPAGREQPPLSCTRSESLAHFRLVPT
jgi:hypothetical protein